MLSAVIAQPGTNSYTLHDGETLEVNGDYDEPLNVTFLGEGRVNVRPGAELGQARFTVDPNGTLGETRVVFYDGSSAQGVTYVGAGNTGGVYALAGSDLGNVVVDASNDQGHDAQTLLRLANGSTTEDIVFFGSRGRDLMLIGGNVATGNISADLSGGDDYVRFENSATVQAPVRPDDFALPDGIIGIQTRAGDDTVLFQGGRYDNLDLGTGDGVDRVFFRGDSPRVQFDGEVDVRTGNGDDQIQATGITSAVRGFTFEAGAGDDLIRLQNLEGGNAQFEDPLVIDAGVDGSRRDTIQVGNLLYLGAVDVGWGGDVAYVETAFNSYRPFSDGSVGLRMQGGTDGSAAIIRLRSGSEVRGSFAYESPSQTSFIAEEFAVTGRTSIVTGERSDSIRLSNGTAGLATVIETAGGNDLVKLEAGQFLGETGFVDVGLGADRVRVTEAGVGASDIDGTLNVSFGGDLGSTSFLQTRGDGIVRYNVEYAGRFKLDEVGAVSAFDGYIISEDAASPLAGSGPISIVGDAASDIGILRLTTSSAAAVTYSGAIRNRIDIATGDFADTIDLSGAAMDAGGVADIATGGNDDTVLLVDAAISDLTLDLGDGNDSLDNTGTNFLGTNSLDGGAGDADTAEANNGNLVNFEIVH